MISPTFGLAQSNWRSMTLIAAINKKPITRTAMMGIVICLLSIIADNALSNQAMGSFPKQPKQHVKFKSAAQQRPKYHYYRHKHNHHRG